MSVSVYQPAVVAGLQAHYGPLLMDYERYPTVGQHLKALALRLYEGVQTELPVLWQEINNYHPDFLGLAPSELQAHRWTLEACALTTAREYGFADWRAVEEQVAVPYSVPFEQAVQALLLGEEFALRSLLKAFPQLVQQRSTYGHGATLLHYAANNGVEMWRQQVPKNLPLLVSILREAGADPSATMKVYGGEYTPLALAETSAHPKDAGIAEALTAAFRA